jgi:hypothetical protein
MNVSLFGYGIILSGHYYRRGHWHQCEFRDCPSRIPDAEIKYVIANRIVGSYSERFDSREDVERALKYFAPIGFSDSLGLGKRYEILESVQGMGGTWIIGDPTLPSDQVFFVNDSAVSK